VLNSTDVFIPVDENFYQRPLFVLKIRFPVFFKVVGAGLDFIKGRPDSVGDNKKISPLYI